MLFEASDTIALTRMSVPDGRDRPLIRKLASNAGRDGSGDPKRIDPANQRFNLTRPKIPLSGKETGNAKEVHHDQSPSRQQRRRLEN